MNVILSAVVVCIVEFVGMLRCFNFLFMVFESNFVGMGYSGVRYLRITMRRHSGDSSYFNGFLLYD